MIDIATHYIHGYTSKCLGKAKEVDISIYVATCCILLAERDTELNPLQLRKASEAASGSNRMLHIKLDPFVRGFASKIRNQYKRTRRTHPHLQRVG